MKFKIVLVTFPFDDFSDSKLRPALCLTDPISGHKHKKIHRLITTSDNIIQKVIGTLPVSYESNVYEKIKLLFKIPQ